VQLLEDVKKTLGFTEDIQIAVLLGKDKSTISKWRSSGKIPAQAEKELKKILSEYGVRPADAFDIPPPTSKIPIVSWAQAGPDGYFTDSHIVGSGYGEINRPYDVTDPQAYALIVSGDSMAPKYEAGDILVVSPNRGAQIGDYAVVKLIDGSVMAKRVKEKNGSFTFESVNPDYEPIVCRKEDVVFMHRIVWVKQRG
jgi:phage repressor protein C with HTH and peptisase S24 domain